MDTETMNKDSDCPILSYLRRRLPGFPFEDSIDIDFVGELLEDFANSDVLEEIKAFRWYHDNEPAVRVANQRLAIRRWISNSNARKAMHR
jgi:hypothetical protein